MGVGVGVGVGDVDVDVDVDAGVDVVDELNLNLRERCSDDGDIINKVMRERRCVCLPPSFIMCVEWTMEYGFHLHIQLVFPTQLTTVTTLPEFLVRTSHPFQPV